MIMPGERISSIFYRNIWSLSNSGNISAEYQQPRDGAYQRRHDGHPAPGHGAARHGGLRGQHRGPVAVQGDGGHRRSGDAKPDLLPCLGLDEPSQCQE